MARVPKKMTKRRLRNIITYYLSQRTTTRGHLRRLQMNRIRRSLQHHEGDEAEMAGWVDGILDDMERIGLLNDARWAESRVARLLRKGMSERAIRSNLRAKLVPADIIDRLLEEAEPDPVQSAAMYARRRRIGPFRDREREEKRERDLAKLARAGFGYDTARRVLELEPDEALDLAIEGRFGR